MCTVSPYPNALGSNATIYRVKLRRVTSLYAGVGEILDDESQLLY